MSKISSVTRNMQRVPNPILENSDIKLINIFDLHMTFIGGLKVIVDNIHFLKLLLNKAVVQSLLDISYLFRKLNSSMKVVFSELSIYFYF